MAVFTPNKALEVNGREIYPLTHAKQVILDDGKRLDVKLKEIEQDIPNDGNDGYVLTDSDKRDIAQLIAVPKITMESVESTTLGKGVQITIETDELTSEAATIWNGKNGTSAYVRTVTNDDNTVTIIAKDASGTTETTIKNGQTPNLSIGTITTLEPGAQATATITGTAENPLLSLGIPSGESISDQQIASAVEGYLTNNPVTGKTQYIHIKYSNDGKTFSNNMVSTDIKDWKSGFYANNGISANSKYICYDQLFQVAPGEKYMCANGFANGIVRNGFSWYDGNKNFREATYNGKDTITVPANCYYCRIFLGADSNSNWTYETFQNAFASGEIVPTLYGEGPQGEQPGAYMGTLIDFEEEGSLIFSEYKWNRIIPEDDHINNLINSALGVIENGTY